MKNAYIVYIIDNEGNIKYLVSSGGMTFTVNINNAYQYDSASVIDVANYIKSTKTGKASLEVGYVEIQRTLGKKTTV